MDGTHTFKASISSVHRTYAGLKLYFELRAGPKTSAGQPLTINLDPQSQLPRPAVFNKNIKYELSGRTTKFLSFHAITKPLLTLFSFHLSYLGLTLILMVALLIGMAKTGVHGAGMMSVPLLANVFGGQLSSGIMLPILVMADVMGVWYYHRHASWKHLRILFPWAALGVILGTITGNYINDHGFKIIMAFIIVVSVVIMLWLEKGHQEEVPHKKWFGIATGVAGGFTSMVGNLANSVMAVYLLAVKLPKNAFIGTTAWFFLVVNWFKVPFHIFAWHTITWNSLLLDLITLPAIGLGALLGVVIVRSLSEKIYRWFIISMTIIAALFMVI